MQPRARESERVRVASSVFVLVHPGAEVGARPRPRNVVEGQDEGSMSLPRALLDGYGSTEPGGGGIVTTSRRHPPCERCGGQCRTEKDLYGWICGKCEDELDRYYMVLEGMVGGDGIELYLKDLRAGTVPKPSR